MAQLKLTQLLSDNRRGKSQVACLRGLGLRGIRKEVVVEATQPNLGMINKVSFMLRIEKI